MNKFLFEVARYVAFYLAMAVLVTILVLFLCELVIAAMIMVLGFVAWELFNLPSRMVTWRERV